MNCAKGYLSELCKNGRIDELLKSYVELCSIRGEKEDSDEQPKRSTRQSPQQRTIFPNIAGFCRYLGTSTHELETLAAEYPEEYGRILTVLEDEALNSGLSATLLSAYLKKRLGYDSPQKSSNHLSQLEICFEHDIMEDGE
jgi:hypothetical protein